MPYLSDPPNSQHPPPATKGHAGKVPEISGPPRAAAGPPKTSRATTPRAGTYVEYSRHGSSHAGPTAHRTSLSTTRFVQNPRTPKCNQTNRTRSSSCPALHAPLLNSKLAEEQPQNRCGGIAYVPGWCECLGEWELWPTGTANGTRLAPACRNKHQISPVLQDY